LVASALKKHSEIAKYLISKVGVDETGNAVLVNTE